MIHRQESDPTNKTEAQQTRIVEISVEGPFVMFGSTCAVIAVTGEGEMR
jgi:hypothetical protein